MLRRHLALVFFIALISTPLWATTHQVSSGQSIQATIEVAAPGDTIFVSSGVYSERLDFLGKNLALIAPDGSEMTTILRDGSGSVLTLVDISSGTSLVRGFTITGGDGTRCRCG